MVDIVEKNAYIPMNVDASLYKEKIIEILFGEEIKELYKKTVLK